MVVCEVSSSFHIQIFLSWLTLRSEFLVWKFGLKELNITESKHFCKLRLVCLTCMLSCVLCVIGPQWADSWYCNTPAKAVAWHSVSHTIQEDESCSVYNEILSASQDPSISGPTAACFQVLHLYYCRGVSFGIFMHVLFECSGVLKYCYQLNCVKLLDRKINTHWYEALEDTSLAKIWLYHVKNWWNLLYQSKVKVKALL
jgi:hypothetical protein